MEVLSKSNTSRSHNKFLLLFSEMPLFKNVLLSSIHPILHADKIFCIWWNLSRLLKSWVYSSAYSPQPSMHIPSLLRLHLPLKKWNNLEKGRGKRHERKNMGGSVIPDEHDKVILEWIEHGWKVIISKFSQISKILLSCYFWLLKIQLYHDYYRSINYNYFIPNSSFIKEKLISWNTCKCFLWMSEVGLPQYSIMVYEESQYNMTWK